MKRVLVAGATGYLGGYVAQEFRDRGHFVRVLARSPEKLGHMPSSSYEVFQGEITQPRTLEHICDGIDAVFSSIGITRQKNGLTFQDVDYQGNKNLLDVALRAGVHKFMYVSVLGGPRLRHLNMVAAHENFVDELKRSGIPYTVLRPTGYFSDMGEIYKMARKGRVWLIGKGMSRVNPIHGADLAAVCADALDSDETEIEVGGPQAFTWGEVAKLAFHLQGRSPRVTYVPRWLVWMVVRLVALFNRQQGDLLAFFATVATIDEVAPSTGTHTLEAYFRGLGAES